MDFVQERYIKDKYIGDMDLIKNLGDGRIAPAISQLNSNLTEKITVIYNPETDYIQVNYLGNIKNVLKVGLKTWTVYKNGILDGNVALSSAGYNNIGVVQESNYMTFNAPTSAIDFTYNYYSFDLGDITPWTQMTISCSCDLSWSSGGANTYNKIGLSTSRNVTPNIQVQIPQNSQTTLTFNLEGLTGKHYLTFVTHCYNSSNNLYPTKTYCYSIVLS